MGIFLVRQNDEETNFTWLAWERLLKLAIKHGWKPAGTIDPYWGDPDGMHGMYGVKSSVNVQKTWCGTYCANEYQLVTREDAQAMCKALGKARQEIEASLEQQNLDAVDERSLKIRLESIKDFLEFCQEEEFRIY
jgi:hypothetical protein